MCILNTDEVEVNHHIIHNVQALYQSDWGFIVTYWGYKRKIVRDQLPKYL